MQLGKVRQLSEQSPEVFQRLLDRVFSEVEAGELPAAAVTGKILDLVYAEFEATPDTEATAQPAAPEPAPTAESASNPSKPEEAAPPADQPPLESPPADSPDIPARLGNWAAQGLAANRLFRQLKNQGDLESRFVQWKQDGQAGAGQIEQQFVRYFLQQVSRFTIDDQAFSFELPDSIGPMDCSGFEMLIEEGKETGACGIDRRIWGVVGTAFLFLKNAFAPQLGIDTATLGNRGKAGR